jgi:hypothetical protein
MGSLGLVVWKQEYIALGAAQRVDLPVHMLVGRKITRKWHIPKCDMEVKSASAQACQKQIDQEMACCEMCYDNLALSDCRA